MKSLENVVYVDDESDIREVALLALEDVAGFSVQAYASGQQLLQALPATPPDLLLLDVMMPGMDGPTLLQALRAQPAYAQVPVIFMTAKVQPAEVAALRAAGAIGVIAKPFDPMGLGEDIRALWAAGH